VTRKTRPDLGGTPTDPDTRPIYKGPRLKSRLIEAVEVPFRALLYRISPVLLVQYLSLRFRRHLYHPGQARTFDDKLLWLMLYWQEPLKSRCADKLAVRSYVEERGLGRLLPELLGVYGSASEIDLDRLPSQFVLKCTHGSRFNLFCRDKSTFDKGRARKTLDAWLKQDLSKIGAELHYASIRPRIICEALLEDRPSEALDDYKVCCFAGKPHCTMVCTGRSTSRLKFDFYDLPWKAKLPYVRREVSSGRDIPKPAAYEEMVAAAEVLSKPFPFVRVDFYSVNGRAVFGEMTFTPNGCIDLDLTDEAQTAMGDLIILPDRLRARRGRPSRPTT